MTRDDLPRIDQEARRFLHDNPNTGDLVEWVQNYALQAVAALSSAPPDLVAIARDLALRLDVMLRHRHSEAHNGDIYVGGTYEQCALCEETREVIARGLAWSKPTTRLDA